MSYAPVTLATHEWPPSQTDTGAAAPVAVLVHGITGWWRTWWRVAPALAEHGWRVIAVDLRGHGGSPPMPGAMDRADLAADVALTLDGLGVVPVDALIGHSLGAAVVIELAFERPSVARRLVLEDPPGTDRSRDLAYQEHLAREVVAARERPSDEVARALAEDPSWLEEDAVQNVEGQQACDLAGISASLRAGMGARVSALVPQLRIPALYLLAADERSAIWGEQRAQLLAGVPAGSRARELDSGHTIHRDRFGEYLAAVLAWIDVGR